MAFTAEQKRLYRRGLKEVGACPICYKDKADDGYDVCDDCRKKSRDYKLGNINNGLCRDCRAPADSDAQLCVNCAHKHTVRNIMRESL